MALGSATPHTEKRLAAWSGLAFALALLSGGSLASAAETAPQLVQRQAQDIVVPAVDALRGRRLFVMKGCVTCHAVKQVGGKAAPALDAPEGSTSVHLLDFAARMWAGASAMQELQAIELGYRVELTGDEIGDLAAFAADPAAQEGFSIDEVPDLLKDWFIDEPYWEQGEWPETDTWQYPK